ncbi:MAG: homoserine dehydrogenase [Verrucomicrobiota bacterium]|jgi:homoserine dehydrogenase|nr:homoserine dehydrogenase [Verrucomicrobiota bacterium]MDI9384811.1 homoserine dehydrogenase [Verrucomicrobiota bacterium]HCF96643.1 homoserine dehydrogenase [Verrucomicrobiota bacterium]
MDGSKKPVVRVGLLGFGTIGTGVVGHLIGQRQLIADRLGCSIEIARIADLDIERDRGVKVEPGWMTRDAFEVVRDPNVDVVVELIGGTGIAKAVILEAFRNGKPVVTANKALICEHGPELFEAARAAGQDFYFEASVGGGIPIIKDLREGLVGNQIQSVYGILNGTCNYILTRMAEAGLDFDQALAEASQKGYAEADPSLDIDGIDTMHKAVILASLAYGFWVDYQEVYTEGIRSLQAIDIACAQELGYEVKLLAVIRAGSTGGPVEVRVHPAMLPKDHILASVRGVYNAAFTTGDVVGQHLAFGRGAGMDATTSSVIADLADISLNMLHQCPRRVADFRKHANYSGLLPIEDVETRYYIRLSVADQPGVLARIAAIFGDLRISIASMIQHESEHGSAEGVTLIFLTHRAREASIREAVRQVESLPTTLGPASVLRVEEDCQGG